MPEKRSPRTRTARARRTARAEDAATPLPPARARLAVTVLVKAGELNRAREVIDIADAAQRADLRTVLAGAYVAQGEFDAALTEYRAILKTDAHHQAAKEGAVAARAHQAARCAEDKAWDKARPFLNEAIAIAPDDARLARYLNAVEGAAVMAGGALAGKLDDIIGALEKLQSANPARADVAHQLAILFQRQALDLEEMPRYTKARDAAWEKAIANWALTVEADNYWEEWGVARQVAFEQSIPPEEIEKLRRETVKDRIKEMHKQYIETYSREGKSADISRHRRLMAAWTLELKTAAAMREILTLLAKRGKKDSLAVAAGPLFFKHTNTETAVQKAVADVLAIDKSFKAALQVSEYLKPTGLARALLDEAQVDEALAIAEELLTTSPRDASVRALAAEALIGKGRAIAGSDLESALSAWQKAKSFGATDAQIEKVMVEPMLQQTKDAEEAQDLDRADRVLRQGLKFAPQNRLLKNKFAEVANRRVKVTVEGRLGRQPSATEAAAVLDEAQAKLQEADRLAGPNHPDLQKHIAELNKIRTQLSRSLHVDKVNRAIEQATKAIESFKNGASYASVTSELDQALRALEEAQRALPDEAAIRKNVSDLREARQGITRTQASKNNAHAVELANEAQQTAQRGYKWEACNKLKEAEQLLNEALRLDANEQIRKNLSQVQMLKTILSCN